MPNDIANNMADTINQLDEQIKELEAKHWDECRQIAHYDDELKAALNTLKAVLNTLNMYIAVLNTLNMYINVDEALKLIEGGTNE